MTRLRVAGLGILILFAFYIVLLVRGQSGPGAPAFSTLPPATPPPALVGHWKSTTDALSELDITDTQYIEKYEGKLVSRAGYKLTTACQCEDAVRNEYKKPVVLTVRHLPDGDCYCYIISRLDATTLLLLNYGQGGILSFKRVK